MSTHGTALERFGSFRASRGSIQKGMTLKQPINQNLQTASVSPGGLADVAFLAMPDVCAATRMSASWIHDEVRARRFPQPMRFGPRCTRWRSADVRAWLIARAETAEADTETGAQLSARAKKASDAAQVKRLAAAAPKGESQ